MKKVPRLLDGQECALTLLRLIEIRSEEGPAVSRVRLSELTLRRLWGRDRLSRELLEDVQEWVSRGGWVLFFAGTTYAAIRKSAVVSWARVSSKRMADQLEKVRAGNFDFGPLLHLIESEPAGSEED